VDYVI
jgi:hypothetical protein